MLHPAGFSAAANNEVKVTKNRSLSRYIYCSYFTYINVTTVFHGELFFQWRFIAGKEKCSSFSDSVLALLSCLQLMLFVSVKITAFIVESWLRAVIKYYPWQFLFCSSTSMVTWIYTITKKKDLKSQWIYLNLFLFYYIQMPLF